jgi:hypothetical protein
MVIKSRRGIHPLRENRTLNLIAFLASAFVFGYSYGQLVERRRNQVDRDITILQTRVADLEVADAKAE